MDLLLRSSADLFARAQPKDSTEKVRGKCRQPEFRLEARDKLWRATCCGVGKHIHLVGRFSTCQKQI